MARRHFLFRTAAAMAMALPGAAAFTGCDREVIQLLEADEGAESGGAGGDSGAPGPSPTALPVDASSKPSPPAGCTSNAECGPELPACDSARGVCVGCMSSHDCEGSWKRQCNPSTHQCVECLERDDCSPDLICDALTSRCELPCTFDEQCFGLTCDPSRGICVFCLVDADCNQFVSQAFCSAGRCVVQCIEDRDCPFGAHCQFNGECG